MDFFTIPQGSGILAINTVVVASDLVAGIGSNNIIHYDLPGGNEASLTVIGNVPYPPAQK